MKVVDPKRVGKGWKIAAIVVLLWGLLCLLILNTYFVPKEVLLWMLPAWTVGLLVVCVAMIVQGSVDKSVLEQERELQKRTRQ
jgi:uncharacterized integral membrane protein